jgi:hypothetical protein
LPKLTFNCYPPDLHTLSIQYYKFEPLSPAERAPQIQSLFKAVAVAQVIKHLLRKCKTLRSNSSIAKKNPTTTHNNNSHKKPSCSLPQPVSTGETVTAALDQVGQTISTS